MEQLSRRGLVFGLAALAIPVWAPPLIAQPFIAKLTAIRRWKLRINTVELLPWYDAKTGWFENVPAKLHNRQPLPSGWFLTPLPTERTSIGQIWERVDRTGAVIRRIIGPIEEERFQVDYSEKNPSILKVPYVPWPEPTYQIGDFVECEDGGEEVPLNEVLKTNDFLTFNSREIEASQLLFDPQNPTYQSSLHSALGNSV